MCSIKCVCYSAVHAVKGGLQARRTEESGNQWVEWLRINLVNPPVMTGYSDLLTTQLPPSVNSHSKYSDLQQRISLWRPAGALKVNICHWCTSVCCIFHRLLSMICSVLSGKSSLRAKRRTWSWRRRRMLQQEPVPQKRSPLEPLVLCARPQQLIKLFGTFDLLCHVVTLSCFSEGLFDCVSFFVLSVGAVHGFIAHHACFICSFARYGFVDAQHLNLFSPAWHTCCFLSQPFSGNAQLTAELRVKFRIRYFFFTVGWKYVDLNTFPPFIKSASVLLAWAKNMLFPQRISFIDLSEKQILFILNLS